MLEDFLLVIVAGVVGILVGLTGVGGGAVMTPALILLFGVSPLTAVATDLIFATITKLVSGALHNKAGSVDWAVLRRMWLGSLPGVGLGILAVIFFLGENLAVLSLLLATLLAITALSMLRASSSFQSKNISTSKTTAGGVFIGFSVATTSVGAGALGMALLRTLLGDRDPRRLVGTDVVHAIPVALLAGLSYGFAGLIDWNLLVLLISGSIPGVVLGSLLVQKVSPTVMKKILGLVLMLAAAGILAKTLGLS